MLIDKHRKKTVGSGDWGASGKRGLLRMFDYKMQTDDELSEHTTRLNAPRGRESWSARKLFEAQISQQLTRLSHTAGVRESRFYL